MTCVVPAARVSVPSCPVTPGPAAGCPVVVRDTVRTAADPDAAVLQFLQSTYAVGADMGGWDRRVLEPAELPDRAPAAAVEPGPVTSDLALAAAVDTTDHTRGGGGPQLVVYRDFECPYTAAATQSIGVLLKSGAAFELVFRHFPLRSIHLHAGAAAAASEAAARQGRFWEMHDVLFRSQRHLESADLRRYAERLGLDLARFESALVDPAVAARVERDIESGGRSGVDGTPSLFIDGIRYRGPRDPAGLGEALRFAQRES